MICTTSRQTFYTAVSLSMSHRHAHTDIYDNKKMLLCLVWVTYAHCLQSMVSTHAHRQTRSNTFDHVTACDVRSGNRCEWMLTFLSYFGFVFRLVIFAWTWNIENWGIVSRSDILAIGSQWIRKLKWSYSLPTAKMCRNVLRYFFLHSAEDLFA